MIKARPSRGRTQLSKELAVLWNWRAANGQLKDMACLLFGSAALYEMPENLPLSTNVSNRTGLYP